MLPTAIVRQAIMFGLDMIAICDHNSVENVTAVTRAGERESIRVIPGIEVTSREEVHVLGLFSRIEDALGMQALVYDRLPGENNEEAFGHQAVVDQHDRLLRVNPRLLIGATALTLEEVVDAIHDFGGLAIASHVDRESFGLIGQLGFIPDGLKLDALEISPGGASNGLRGFPVVTSSDAHCLEDIGRGATLFWAQEGSVGEIARAFRGEEGRRACAIMEDLSLHILDIVENSIAAAAGRIEIAITEDTQRDVLSLEISDDGRGMDVETRNQALDPFYTTRTTRRVGLGLPLLAQAAREAGGHVDLDSEPGRGTRIRAVFQLSHPDLKPLGDIPRTLETILHGQAEVDLRFEYKRDSELVAELGSRPDE